MTRKSSIEGQSTMSPLVQKKKNIPKDTKQYKVVMGKCCHITEFKI